MKKPDRKEFRREYGPRAPQKFAAAMQKYRKAQAKKKKLGPPTPSTSRIGKLTDPMVQRRRDAKKISEDTTAKTPKKDTTVKTRKPGLQNTRPAPAKPKAQEPVVEKKGSGVTGKFRKSNPPSPTVSLPTKRSGRTVQKDPRSRGLKTNLNQALASQRQRERQSLNRRGRSIKKSNIADRPPANPKEGDMYKRPSGPVMVYKNGKFVRK